MTEAIVERLSIRAFESPLSDRRWNNGIRDLSDPVNVGLLIVDFETEVMMNGIADFIGNQTGTYTSEIVQALEAVGCSPEAALLSQIIGVASEAGMTHEAIQADRSQLPVNSVTSFKTLHGDKWRAAVDEMDTLADRIDFESVFAALEQFAQAHRAAFEAVLRA